MTFDALYGLDLTDCSDSLVRGRVSVRDELMQAAGAVHGGVYGAISEALACCGTDAGVGGNGRRHPWSPPRKAARFRAAASAAQTVGHKPL